MTVRPDAARGADLLRRWRALVVPVEAAERAASRRERMVERIGEFVRHASRRQRGRRVRRRAVAALAVAAAVGLGLGLWQATGAGPAPSVSSARRNAPSAFGPAVHVQAAHGTVVAGVGDRGRVVPLARRVELRSGDELSTAVDGRAALELSGGARLELAASTRLRVVETQLAAQRLLLLGGRLEVAVPDAAAEQRLAIETPDAEVHVVGTHFSVELRRAADSGEIGTVVEVWRGKVRVIRRGGDAESVEAGGRWVSSSALDAPPLRGCTDDEREGEPAQRAAVRAPGATAADEPPSELTAQNRLYQAALDARNRGNDTRALRLLERFLARYPSSLLAQEARIEHFRTLRRMGRSREAARQARAYLAEHERGYAREEARELVLTPSE